MHAFPAAFPLRVSEEAPQDRRVKIAFAFEITIEAAVGQAGASHDLFGEKHSRSHVN